MIDKYLKNPQTEEKKFQYYFVNNYGLVLKSSRYITHEAPLFKISDILSNTTSYDIDLKDSMETTREKMGIGRIDLIFQHKSKRYCAEIKYRKCDNNDFWDAVKIIAYTEYYKWQTDDNDYLPAIILPSESLTNEHQIAAGRCGIALFVVDKKEDGYSMKLVDGKPSWKN